MRATAGGIARRWLLHESLSIECSGNFMKHQIIRNLVVGSLCMAPLAWSVPSPADEYHRGQFLGLDLSTAVLSPKPLGPADEFVPDPVHAKVDAKFDWKFDWKADVKAVSAPDRGSEDAHAASPLPPEVHVAHLRGAIPVRKRHVIAHARLARRHGNPLDAQASDLRIKAWPCRSGGICDWKRGEQH
jgi:hypothetical protein